MMLIGDEPQSYPSYRDIAVDRKDGATCFTEIAIGPRLSFEEMSAVLNQHTFLWLYGVVAFADVRGTQWETEFCFRYNGAENYLEPFPRSRNKCTRKQAT
jgi:hypothetical protein